LAESQYGIPTLAYKAIKHLKSFCYCLFFSKQGFPCTWIVRNLYRSGSITTAARELARYKLDLVGVLEVRWDKGGKVRAGDCNFFYGKGNENHQMEIEFFVHHRIVSAVKRVEFVNDSTSYIVVKGRWYNIKVLNVQAPSEEKSDD
jgi:hypothetical protein